MRGARHVNQAHIRQRWFRWWQLAPSGDTRAGRGDLVAVVDVVNKDRWQRFTRKRRHWWWVAVGGVEGTNKALAAPLLWLSSGGGENEIRIHSREHGP